MYKLKAIQVGKGLIAYDRMAVSLDTSKCSVFFCRLQVDTSHKSPHKANLVNVNMNVSTSVMHYINTTTRDIYLVVPE